ncbi:MAG: CHAT domain-containing protein [Actinomycetota bacterium]|nr:CHAT domain-containing protein [Actinomycetota bacterium]
MSSGHYESRIRQLRAELSRHRKRHTDEGAKAVRLDGEALRHEKRAAGTKSESLARSYGSQADRKRSDAQKAREAATKASRAVAETQTKLTKAEADANVARERERKREEEKAARKRREAERRQERALAALQRRAGAVEAELSREPWAAAPETITVLFVSAAPQDQHPLRLGAEVREIQQRVRMSEFRDSLTFRWAPAARPGDLLQAINQHQPDVIHFSGHGDRDELVFEDADGFTKPLSGDQIAVLLRTAREGVRVVVFNACRSADLAERACDHVDAAIGMDESVEDDAAKLFAGQFYNAIGFGQSLAQAFEQAKTHVMLETGGTSGEPRLHTAAGVDGDSIYLVRPPRAKRSA